MKYTIDTLREINARFCGSHILMNYDVDKANMYVELIENTRSEKTPSIGDCVRYTNEYGDYYGAAHIEKADANEIYICERPYTPFVHEYEGRISCNTSGGAWTHLPTRELKYIGKIEKRFCDWGNCGGCADGAIDFIAEVNLWEYVDSKNPFVSENGYKFTTKDFDKQYISFNPKDDSPYVYFGEGCAWKSKTDLYAYLRTYRAEIFKGHWQNQFIVWTWKEKQHHVSPTEFDRLKLEEDTFLMNGDIMRCKRKYDEITYTVHTYYVWYWDDPTKDFFEASAEQNKIREKYYTLDRKTPTYIVAREEIMSGIEIPKHGEVLIDYAE